MATAYAVPPCPVCGQCGYIMGERVFRGTAQFMKCLAEGGLRFYCCNAHCCDFDQDIVLPVVAHSWPVGGAAV